MISYTIAVDGHASFWKVTMLNSEKTAKNTLYYNQVTYSIFFNIRSMYKNVASAFVIISDYSTSSRRVQLTLSPPLVRDAVVQVGATRPACLGDPVADGASPPPAPGLWIRSGQSHPEEESEDEEERLHRPWSNGGGVRRARESQIKCISLLFPLLLFCRKRALSGHQQFIK